MEEPPAHAKRKHYEPNTYARLLTDLTRLMEEVAKVKPDRNAWDIEGEWGATGTIYFIDARHQPEFDSISHFDCRSIKLVNLHKPAVRMTFYKKHRYWLLKPKDLPLIEKVNQIQAYINELILKNQSLNDKLENLTDSKRAEILGKIGSCQQQINQWQQILESPQQYDLALSNYNRQHFYVTLNYKYRLPTGNYTNEQEHLLNTQRNRLGQITQIRYNLIFVDPQEILREHPYQNREVENYLATFSIQSTLGKHTLYARERSELKIMNSFKENIKDIE